jgi:hypothetical protein
MIKMKQIGNSMEVIKYMRKHDLKGSIHSKSKPEDQNQSLS